MRAGQSLVQLEAQSFSETVEAQKHATEQARQQLLEAERGPRPEDIAKQAAALSGAQANYQKLVNGPRPEEIRAARDRLALARSNYRKVAAGSRPEEIQAAQAAANVALEKLRQAERGLTEQERAQLKARVEQAQAAQDLAEKDFVRIQGLYSQGVVSKQQFDVAESNAEAARARTKDAQEAYDRALAGTPAEELGQAREAYRQAQAQLALVKSGSRPEDIQAANAAMREADENLELLLRGSRPEDILAAKAQVDQQRAALLELERGSRPEDIGKSRAATRQAAAQAKSLQANLNERTVYAPLDSIVDRVLVSDGDLVAANGAVVQLENPADIWLRVYLPEDQLPKIKVGDAATLIVDGIDGNVVGLVESIDAKGQFTPANLQSPEERANQLFGVRIRLAHPDKRVKAGMYASVKRMGSWQ